MSVQTGEGDGGWGHTFPSEYTVLVKESIMYILPIILTFVYHFTCIDAFLDTDRHWDRAENIEKM